MLVKTAPIDSKLCFLFRRKCRRFCNCCCDDAASRAEMRAGTKLNDTNPLGSTQETNSASALMELRADLGLNSTW